MIFLFFRPLICKQSCFYGFYSHFLILQTLFAINPQKKRTKGLSRFAYLQAADLSLANTRKMSVSPNGLSFKKLCRFVCEPVIKNHSRTCH